MGQDKPAEAAVDSHTPQYLEQGDQDDLVGNKHSEQEKGKQDLTAAETVFGKNKPVQRTQQGRNNCSAEG